MIVQGPGQGVGRGAGPEVAYGSGESKPSKWLDRGGPKPKRWAIKPDDSLFFFNCWGLAGVGDSVCPQIIVTQFMESIMGLEL